MKLFRKISCFFDRITREIRMIRLKHILIFSLIFLLSGIVSWIIGGGTNRVMLLYIFPRSAINIGFMYILWGVSYIFCGAILAGVLFGCEKYWKHKTYKVALYVILMQIFILIIYPLFFGATAPFLSFLAIVIASTFCLLSILVCVRIYSLWTVCLCLHFLWLLYNGYICLAFIFIN